MSSIQEVESKKKKSRKYSVKRSLTQLRMRKEQPAALLQKGNYFLTWREEEILMYNGQQQELA